MGFCSRKVVAQDLEQLFALYKIVAQVPGGLARRPHEISEAFIDLLFSDTQRGGVFLCLEELSSRQIVGAIHATYNDIESLRHVMGGLTILIHPELQGKGLGKALFTSFLECVEAELPFIMRVELRARSSNLKAIRLYEDLGFRREGKFQSRIISASGEPEDGIPMVWFNPSWRKPSLLAPAPLTFGR